ncbi:MAG: EF-hand domain-containing protein, partial [Actinomycetota bacterium]
FDEYVRIWESYAGLPNYGEAVDQFAGFLTQVCDRDSDGKISASDWALFSQVWELPAVSAGEAFARLDTDDDGVISNDEVQSAVREFFAPVTGDEPGNWLFGAPA